MARGAVPMEFPERNAVRQHSDEVKLEAMPLDVHCVHQEGVEFRAALMEAFKVLLQNQSGTVRARWKTEDEIPHLLSTSPSTKDTVFVCEDFHGATFNLLRSRNFKIVGPECITGQQNVLHMDGDNSTNPPLFNTLLQGIVVCFSGFTVKQMKNMQEKILLMGGSTSGSLRPSVTHLVAKSVNTEKYLAATGAGMKIMQSSWVDTMWKQSLLGNYAGRDEVLELEEETHALPYLQGLTIFICPDLNKKTGGSYQGLVEKGGATLATNIRDKAITHYVCKNSPLDDALDGVPCVQITWLLECARARLCQKWAPYLILPTRAVEVPSLPSRASWSRPTSGNRKRTLSPPSSSHSAFVVKRAITTPKTISDVPFLPPSSPFNAVTASKACTPRSGESTPLNASFGFELSESSPKHRTCRSASRKLAAAVDGPSASKMFHDENARDGLSEDTSPTKKLLTADSTSTKMSHTEDSAPPALVPQTQASNSATDAQLTGSEATVCVVQTVKPPAKLSPHKHLPSSHLSSQHSISQSSTNSASRDMDLARRILDMPKPNLQGRKSLGGKSPRKLSMEKMLRPGRSSWNPLFPYSLMSPLAEDSCSPPSPAIEWEEELETSANLREDKQNECPSSSSIVTETPTKRGVFMILRMPGIDTKESTTLSDKITALGSSCIDSPAYDPTGTHLVCERPRLTEKFISCVAAGVWVLHPQYIHDSAKAGVLLEEEPYEWGNVFAAKYNLDLLDQELSWASTAHWWRQYIARTGEKAYYNFRVILSPDIPRIQAYKNVIRAGGGTILSMEDNAAAASATHLLHNFKLSEEEKLQAFRSTLPGLTAPSHSKGFLEGFLKEKAVGHIELRKRCYAQTVPRRVSTQSVMRSRSSDLFGGSARKSPRIDPPSFQSLIS
ncbi:putative DNA topoisomerase 2-binding protein 1 [Hypsibius exemplaris]|uniref:DNA topoisomerase 2-binding protein 1 n=1 Tax=Hypsibius exemplaris TaxID=2072580 RepID=A0A9X6RNN4_HYPEX|nr:putative DNA topoisomerase 2-binding protein 1 [Hypsibius exemplaris]